jgi:hypothetical protein
MFVSNNNWIIKQMWVATKKTRKEKEIHTYNVAITSSIHHVQKVFKDDTCFHNEWTISLMIHFYNVKMCEQQ